MRVENQIQVRSAVRADAPSISAVLYEAFEEFRPLYTEGGFTATTPTADLVEARMAEGPVWVAPAGEVVMGTCSVVSKGEGLYVRGMGVVPSARGLGIGELLLRQAESYAAEQGFKRMCLSTTPFLDRAIRLYERFGFRRTDAGPHDLFGTPLFTMEKSLEGRP